MFCSFSKDESFSAPTVSQPKFSKYGTGKAIKRKGRGVGAEEILRFILN